MASLLWLVGLIGSSSAMAQTQNVIRLNPADMMVESGASNIELDLELEFTDVTTGGGVEIRYDASRLEFVSFTFSNDPNFGLSGPADGETDQPLEIGAGWFVTQPPFGVSGLHTLGTFVFRAIADGPATIETAASAVSPGPFFAPSNPSVPLPVSFEGADVQIGPVAVPAMGRVGLLITFVLLCLISIGGQRNRARQDVRIE